MPESTPGPWGWFGNSDGQMLYLSTIDRGRRFVMQFARWGTRNAQPVFQRRGVMVPARDFLKFEVGDREVTGVDQAKLNSSVYRRDIIDIDHPDARLIQAAPDLYGAVRDQVAWIERLLQSLEHRDVTDHRGDIINGFACAAVPDWELRQKLDSLKEDLKLAEEGR